MSFKETDAYRVKPMYAVQINTESLAGYFWLNWLQNIKKDIKWIIYSHEAVCEFFSHKKKHRAFFDDVH